MQNPSPEYLQISRQGAFPNQIDPWAEQAYYFHQLHGHMIGYMVDQISDALFARGYITGRERSIQINTSYPDISIKETRRHPPKSQKYAEIVATLELDAGVPLVDADLDMLFIKEIDTGKLVTVLEIVSPSNKTSLPQIETYQLRRTKLLLDGVNVVEVDFTRSLKRLLDNPITAEYPYHIAVYPYDEETYFIGMTLHDSPKTFALPLRDDVFPIELAPVYREAYIKLSIAPQIHQETAYSVESLPFPSLLQDSEKVQLLQAVERWQAALKAAQI